MTMSYTSIKRINISFLLHLRQFLYIDSLPNAILLFLSTDQYTKPLAYYAPVGNKYWTDFNTTHLNGVPIYSPNPTQYTEISFCLHNNTEQISLIWVQDNYTTDADIWSISRFLDISSQQMSIANE